MDRPVLVAGLCWSVAIGLLWLFFGGGHVQGCLGPLGVTPQMCRVALGLPPETDWDRFVAGPGPWAAIVVAGWIGILAAGAWWKRQRGGL